MTFVHQFSRKVRCTIHVADEPPAQGEIHQFNTNGRALKPTQTREYVRWVCEINRLLAIDGTKESFMGSRTGRGPGILGVRPNQAPKLLDEVGSASAFNAEASREQALPVNGCLFLVARRPLLCESGPRSLHRALSRRFCRFSWSGQQGDRFETVRAIHATSSWLCQVEGGGNERNDGTFERFYTLVGKPGMLGRRAPKDEFIRISIAH